MALALSKIYAETGKSKEAIRISKKIVDLYSNRKRDRGRELAFARRTLAFSYLQNGHPEEAIAQLKEAVKFARGHYSGKSIFHLSYLLADLAESFERNGQSDEAEKAYEEAVFQLDHPHPKNLFRYARLLSNQGDFVRARELSRKGLDMLLKNNISDPVARESVGEYFLRSQARQFISILGRGFSAGSVTRSDITEKGFLTSQLTQGSDVAKALRSAVVRRSKSDVLSTLIRRKQDVARQLEALERHYLDAAQSGRIKRADEVLSSQRKLRDEQESLDKKLRGKFPKYFDFVDQKAVRIDEIRNLLSDREALFKFTINKGDSHLWVIRNSGAAYYKLNTNSDEVAEHVAQLRASLDPTGSSYLSDLPRFPAKDAYALYKKLIVPALGQLEGIDEIIYVPDGRLASLPLDVLLTEKRESIPNKNAEQLRDMPWLLNKFSVTVLPSVQALRTLRTFSGEDVGQTNPFWGFGDPGLEGPSGKQRGMSGTDLQTRGRTFFRDLEELRALSPLPETADELRAIADTLGADPKYVVLGKQASETVVKKTNLQGTRVLAFATHGLLAGDFNELYEPALVLSPPDVASKDDDGLLTSSEVAELKISADWVILSACNTASSDGSSEEGLSGLARSFFYAGARSLLVSHWPVETNAAKRLTTSTFRIRKSRDNISKVQALREAKLEMIKDKSNPQFAHPSLWAPFILVGDGGDG